MTRRNLELVLLCVAVPIVVLMFAMLALNQGQRLGLTTLGVPLGLTGAPAENRYEVSPYRFFPSFSIP